MGIWRSALVSTGGTRVGPAAGQAGVAGGLAGQGLRGASGSGEEGIRAVEGGANGVADISSRLHEILAMPDPVRRLETLRDWVKSLPENELTGVLISLKTYADAEEEFDHGGSIGMVVQAAETIADALLARGGRASLDLLLAGVQKGGDSGVLSDVMPVLFGKWAARDFGSARTWLEHSLTGTPEKDSLRRECSQSLVRTWVKSDSSAALDWIAGLPPGEQESLVAPAFQTLSHVDSAKAMTLLAERTDLPGRDKIAREMAGWWAKTEPGKALDWSAGLGGNLAWNAAGQVINTWAETDFAAARKGFEGLEGTVRAVVLQTLASRWPESDFAGGAAFLTGEPESRYRADAMQKLVSHWAAKDEESASAWLAAQPPGLTRDAGAQSLSERVRDTDPEAAQIWAATIQDEPQRRATLGSNFEKWRQRTPEAAMQWLENSPDISSADREELRARFSKP